MIGAAVATFLVVIVYNYCVLASADRTLFQSCSNALPQGTYLSSCQGCKYNCSSRLLSCQQCSCPCSTAPAPLKPRTTYDSVTRHRRGGNGYTFVVLPAPPAVSGSTKSCPCGDAISLDMAKCKAGTKVSLDKQNKKLVCS